MQIGAGVPTDQNMTEEHKTVLLVEDDEDLRHTLAELIRKAGYAVETACNGREGIDKLATLGPCLVLLDLLMPEMTGWDVLRQLEEMGRSRRDVIVLSAAHHQAPPGYRQLHKPVELPTLLSVLKQRC